MYDKFFAPTYCSRCPFLYYFHPCPLKHPESDSDPFLTFFSCPLCGFNLLQMFVVFLKSYHKSKELWLTLSSSIDADKCKAVKYQQISTRQSSHLAGHVPQMRSYRQYKTVATVGAYFTCDKLTTSCPTCVQRPSCMSDTVYQVHKWKIEYCVFAIHC